jgi:hypothetical protein
MTRDQSGHIARKRPAFNRGATKRTLRRTTVNSDAWAPYGRDNGVMRGGSHATADRLGAGRNPGGGALGAAVSQTRVDPATGAAIPGAAPATAPAAAAPTTRRPGLSVLNRPPRGGQVDWRAAVGGLRQGGGANPRPTSTRPRSTRPACRSCCPPTPDLTAGARIYSFGDYYTITADAPGAGVSLSGTTAVVPLPAGTPLKITPMGPEGATSQRTVDGQLISFVRYGVLYTVEVRCDAPDRPALRRRQLRPRPGRQDHRRGDGRRRPRRRRPGGLSRCASCCCVSPLA